MKWFGKAGSKLVTFFIVLMLFLFLIYINAFSNLNSVITDNLYGGKKPLENIIIIGIDDESINRIGRWPWDRDVFAQMLGNIEGAKAIGMDLSFFEASENDEALSEQLNVIDNVVLAAEINEGKLYRPIFENRFGYVNFKADADGVIRKVDSSLMQGVLPFAFELYKKGWNKNFKAGKKEHLINFADMPGSFVSYSAFEILGNQKNFEGKFVLLGATAPDLHDNYFVPTSDGVAMSGVEIHANILQNLILGNFLESQGKAGVLIFVLIAGIFGMFLISRLKIYYAIPLALGIITLYSLIGIMLFSKFNYLINFFYFPVSLLVFTGAGFGVNYLEQKKQTAHLTDAFGKYISKDLLREIITHQKELKLGGAKRTITIFFSDVRDFTTISERLRPEELVHLLNQYLTEMTKIILANNGTVDKFIGDAVMAFWNAPLVEERHAQLACKTAVEQLNALGSLREKWRKEKLPEIGIGVGIHTGEAIIGNMGSEDRFDYTAMGDTINLGSRLEGLTKQYGVSIIISEATYKIVKDEFKCRKLDAVKVKGKKISVVIYELCAEYDKKFVSKYENALKLYLSRKFRQALKEFDSALKMKKDDKSCNLFIERCKAFIKTHPPKNWDGAWEFKTK